MEPLPPEDLERLQTALGWHQIDPGRSLFDRGSVARRINREGVLLLGGGRALLLQVAHPLIAAGVAAHSQFRLRPLDRLWRTLDLMLTLVFADARRGIVAVREIERVHARVHGVLDQDVGPFPRGTRYDASAPELLLWVHATLVDTAIFVYDRFVEPLPAAARNAYVEESAVVARLFGISQALIPRTLESFERYVEDMVQSDTLSVGPAGREIAASILHPPVILPLRPLFEAGGFFTAGLLPATVRERYGFGWDPIREHGLDAIAALLRTVLPHLPDALRLMPHARRA